MKKIISCIIIVCLCCFSVACSDHKEAVTPNNDITQQTAEVVQQTEQPQNMKQQAWEKACQWLAVYYGKEIVTDQFSDEKVEETGAGYIITIKYYLEDGVGNAVAKTATLTSDLQYYITDAKGVETIEIEETEKPEEKEPEEKKSEENDSTTVQINNNCFITTPEICYEYYWDYEYVIYDSDYRYLTYDELCWYTLEELRLARNEIYARHGRLFKSQELQDYFWHKSWYYGSIAPDEFDASVFNQYESANIKLIKQVEEDMK